MSEGPFVSDLPTIDPPWPIPVGLVAKQSPYDPDRVLICDLAHELHVDTPKHIGQGEQLLIFAQLERALLAKRGQSLDTYGAA